MKNNLDISYAEVNREQYFASDFVQEILKGLEDAAKNGKTFYTVEVDKYEFENNKNPPLATLLISHGYTINTRVKNGWFGKTYYYDVSF